MDKKERQLYLATVPSSAFESGNLKRYYGCLTCYPFISDKLNHPSFDVQDVINDYDYVHQSDLREYPNYDAERTESLKLIQETFRLSAHILREHPEQLISQLLGRLFYPSLLENSYIQSFLEQAKAKIVPPALIPYLGSLQPPGSGLIRTFAGHLGFISSLAITPDGTKVVSGSNDRTIKIWNLTTGQELLTFFPCYSTAGLLSWLFFLFVKVTPDGTKVIAGSTEGTIEIWDLNIEQELCTLYAHTETLTTVDITPDGEKIVSGSVDETIKVWDLVTGQQLLTLTGHQDDVLSLAITPDGEKIISGSADKTIKVWDLVTGQQLLTFSSIYPIALAITHDGTKVVSGGSSGIQVWDLAIAKELFIPSFCTHATSVNEIVITPDGNHLISGSQDDTIKIWNIATSPNLFTFSDNTQSVTKLVVTPDGSKIIFVDCWGDKQIKMMNFSRKQKSEKIIMHFFKMMRIKLKRLWNLATRQEISTLTSYNNSYTFAITPDGTKIITGGWSGEINVWNLAEEQKLYGFSTEKDIVETLLVTPDGTKMISISKDRIYKGKELDVTYQSFIEMWNLETGKKICTLSSHNGSTDSIVVTPDGTKVIYTIDDKTLEIWDLRLEKKLMNLEIGEALGNIYATIDNNKIICITNSFSIKLVDLSTGSCVTSFTNDNPIDCCVISPDGKKVIAGDGAGRLHFLELIV
jgi:WD40 repeat protein